MNRVLTTLGLLLLSCTGFAAQSLYCPQKAGYINVGMTEDQVRAACGEPLSKQESNNPIMQKVQVQQLFLTIRVPARPFMASGHYQSEPAAAPNCRSMSSTIKSTASN